MPLQTKLERIGNAIVSAFTVDEVVTLDVYHYFRPIQNAPYIVWAEDQDIGLEADNVHEEQAIQGTVDYYTKTEYDGNCDTIQAALTSADASWYLNSVQYEDSTNLIHYEWVWSVA